MKQKIEELIVVEGKNDAFRIQQVVDANIIITGGLSMRNDVLNNIEEIAKHRGIIVFTDPDGPGNRIRHAIEQRVPTCKHAYLPKEKALGENKVGIEHAKLEDILFALQNLTSPQNQHTSLSWEEYVYLGLTGPNSATAREQVSQHYHIGYANAKTFYHRLSMVDATFEEIERILSK